MRAGAMTGVSRNNYRASRRYDTCNARAQESDPLHIIGTQKKSHTELCTGHMLPLQQAASLLNYFQSQSLFLHSLARRRRVLSPDAQKLHSAITSIHQDSSRHTLRLATHEAPKAATTSCVACMDWASHSNHHHLSGLVCLPRHNW